MNSMIVLAVVAVLAPAALAAPSGWPVGGVLGLGHGGLVAAPHAVALAAAPVAVSHSSLVQTHPSPAVVVAAPAVHGPAVIAAPAIYGGVLGGHGVHGAGLIAAGPHSALIAGPAGVISEHSGLAGSIAVGHGLHHW
ncbi:larval cuticle protein F1-like [Frankliniella occidentalis]|uniref:Larval cuticle protein F1-like n=1 Tax=Frankliniella occidentalis TaxID=133901 RepID=A0A6J1SZA8_FRAOC|nr:larval cuticle protein F1-like [Frankliniella occidentalis]